MIAFLGVTAHAVDAQWQQQDLLLGFHPLHGPHTGENMAGTLISCLKDFGILDKVSEFPCINHIYSFRFHQTFLGYCHYNGQCQQQQNTHGASCKRN